MMQTATVGNRPGPLEEANLGGTVAVYGSIYVVCLCRLLGLLGSLEGTAVSHQVFVGNQPVVR